ncbi:MAG: flavodoxin family protein [Candidatus Xenobiia bacterium LiM19]
MKKVVILFGSPRKNSNTHLLVEEARRGLTDSGSESSVFFLNDLKIKGCQACYYCKKNNVAECAVKDDMQPIYQAIREADGIIVASPIYFGEVTAQTKLWIDRMFPFIDKDLKSLLPKSLKAAFIFTQNQPCHALFEGYMEAFRTMLCFMGFEKGETLLACDLDKGYKPMVTEDRELMEKAYNLGKDFFSK